MKERDMEDLIAKYPDDFFPGRGLALKGRQQSFAGVGRFDLLFVDCYGTNWLMELKARTLKYSDEAIPQIVAYRDEIKRRSSQDRVVMCLVAPQIASQTVRDHLDFLGIEYREIHEAELQMVAERHGETIPQQRVAELAGTFLGAETKIANTKGNYVKEHDGQNEQTQNANSRLLQKFEVLLKEIDPRIHLNCDTQKAKDGSYTNIKIESTPDNSILFSKTLPPLGVRVKLSSKELRNVWKKRCEQAGIETHVSEPKLAKNHERELRIVRTRVSEEQFSAVRDAYKELFREVLQQSR